MVEYKVERVYETRNSDTTHCESVNSTRIAWGCEDLGEAVERFTLQCDTLLRTMGIDEDIAGIVVMTASVRMIDVGDPDAPVVMGEFTLA